jgi:hypothetical protein
MAIGAVGGGTPVVAPQAAAAPAAAPAAGGTDATQAEIDQNMQDMGMQMMGQMGMEVQQDAQKIEQQNQARNKELLAEAKKQG